MQKQNAPSYSINGRDWKFTACNMQLKVLWNFLNNNMNGNFIILYSLRDNIHAE